MAKKSSKEGVTVSETVGKAAEGDDSLKALDLQIQESTTTGETFIPMKRICAAMAIYRKILTKGSCKIREGGTPDDFLNFATVSYVERWQKQFTPQHGRKPVAHIQNWIPYISNTIHYCLMAYNKEIQDFDFLPLPNHYTDSTAGEKEDNDLVDEDMGYRQVVLNRSITVGAIHDIVKTMPNCLKQYMPEILYYIRSRRKKFVTEKNKNFVIIGANIFNKGFERWMAD